MPQTKSTSNNEAKLSLEDIANNKFEELAVAVAYAKNAKEKEAAVKAFTDFFNNEVPNTEKTAVKEMLTKRMGADDFIYGSEFIDLTGLRQYQEDMFKAPEISLEDRINNEFDEMAVSVAYAKNEEEKRNAIRTFNRFIEKTVKPEDIESVKAQVAKRLEDNDFIYGSEFIALAELRKYQDMILQKQPDTTQPLNEEELYQALMNGINNEEIKNIKGYSKEDLQKILDTQDELLNSKGNARAFESLHENSIADLKKFADGNLTIDNDSYETMLQFIKIFGTDYKGDLTPEGKAAYDKLTALMAEDKKEKIRKHKEEYQKQKTSDNNQENSVVIPTNQTNETAETPEYFDIGWNPSEEEQKKKEDEEKHIPGVIPLVIPTNEGAEGHNPPSEHTPPAQIIEDKKPEKKKGFWGRMKDKVKRNWKKVAGWAVAAATAAALLFLPKKCSGDPIVPQPDDGKDNKSDTAMVIKPDTANVIKPDTISLNADDLKNGFYLERSAGFKAEQEKIDFHEAEKANKADLLTIKKLLARGVLDQSKFVRFDDSENKEPISVAEIAYKMRIVVQNFPSSKAGRAAKDLLQGNVAEENLERIYSAFHYIDDYGRPRNMWNDVLPTTPGKKRIDPARMGAGSKEYGTQGASNNFTQVLKNHRDALNK